MTDRYFPNYLQAGPELDGEEVTREILKAAAAALKEVKAHAVAREDVSAGGIYVGLGGVALTYLRMAQHAQRGNKYELGPQYLKKHDMGHCLQLSGQFLQESYKLMSTKRVTFLEGASGVVVMSALQAHMNGDVEELRARIKEVTDLWSTRIDGVLPDDECEVLYGRAGYLYSLSWLEEQLGRDVVPRELIKSVVRHLLDEGIRGAAALQAASSSISSLQQRPGSASWGLMYSWHNKRYLGAAHGVAGILYMLLHHINTVRQLDAEQQRQQRQQYPAAAAAADGSSGGYMSALVSSVNALTAAALPSGNLPTKLGDKGDERVAWCHGAAGFLLTLLKAAEVLGDADGRYMSAAVAAADDIWQRGLLRKGVGLCHGICGNGYALLAMARATGQVHYMRAARAFALFAAQHWRDLYEVPDRPASLYEGLCGAVNFWLDVVEPQHSQWPGAELRSQA